MSNVSGFTLIELLVVIAIIAVLALMGFAAFSGLTGKGNDSKRQADMKAIADALEVNKGTNTYYQPISAADFATGVFPKEQTTRTPKYCYQESTNSAIINPASWSALCPVGWMNMHSFTSLTPGNAAYFKVCTMNEAAGGPGAAVICYGSRQ